MNNIYKLTLSFILLFSYKISFSQAGLYGLTSDGGDGFGVLFNTMGDGTNLQALNTFAPNIPGISFQFNNRLCRASNGKFYGVASSGGTYGGGVLFEYEESTNTYVVKHNFQTITGAGTWCSLIEASNGKLYGTTRYGGLNNKGVIFEFDILANNYTKLFDFNSALGSFPFSGLFEASNGKFYGMTNMGGLNGKGTLFEYELSSNTCVTKVDFSNTIGVSPNGSFVELPNGKLYAVTNAGGSSNGGVIFEYDIANSIYTKKIDLNSTTGFSLYCTLAIGTNGKLYGTTNSGGNGSAGVIFEYDAISNIYTKKKDLNTYGTGCYGSLMLASNGKFYGATNSGGTNNKGILFEYDATANTFVKKIDFTQQGGANFNGAFIETTNGQLYGLMYKGGVNDVGVIFQYDILTNTYTKKIDFSSANCRAPMGSLTKGSNGKFYGLAPYGGANDAGVIFEYDFTTNTFAKKIDLISIDGANPYGSLIQATNGKYYGLTFLGGSDQNGVLFEYDAGTNTYTKKSELGSIGGVNPLASLVQANNGKLYGTTSSSLGDIIFEYDISTGICSKKIDLGSFDGPSSCSLMKASNGILYGTTRAGGSNSMGTIFEYDPASNVYMKKIDLSVADGSYPYESLIEGGNGMLYGLTSAGGANNVGVIYEYNITTNTYTRKIDFSSITGKNPHGLLLQASNGKFYGTTSLGGAYNRGVVFEYDYINNIYTKTADFNGLNGSNPEMGSLIEVLPTAVDEKDTKEALNVTLLPNPFSKEIEIQLIDKAKNASVTICNSFGQVVFKKVIYQEYSSFDLNFLSTGIYVFQIINDEQLKTFKLIKE